MRILGYAIRAPRRKVPEVWLLLDSVETFSRLNNISSPQSSRWAARRDVVVDTERARRRVSDMKVMMDLVGLVGGPVRPPLANLRPEEVTAVKTMLEARFGVAEDSGLRQERN